MDILIIDDEQTIRQGLSRLLSAVPGWQVCAALSNGHDALAYLQTHTCDVILTDIRMPDLSGLDMIAQLRQAGRQVPIFILSGYSDFAYAQQAIELGVCKYMTKPTNTKELIEALRKQEALLPPGENQTAVPNLLVTKAMDYMEAHYGEKIALGDVANALQISPNYLSELFRRHKDQTFSEYLLALRIEHAKVYLLDVQYNVAEVSTLVGFSDSRYFSSSFRRVCGMSPSEYRNHHGGGS